MGDKFLTELMNELRETNRLLAILVNQQAQPVGDNISQLLTVKDFIARYPNFTNGGLRQQIFEREFNGLDKSGALIKVGRKVMIDADKYLAWIRTNPKREK